jgi:hypothetical protein
MKLRKRIHLAAVREIARRIRWKADGHGRSMPIRLLSEAEMGLSIISAVYAHAKRMAHHQPKKVRGWFRKRLGVIPKGEWVLPPAGA